MKNSKQIEIFNQFAVDGKVIGVEHYGEGHINRTELIITDKGKYVLQRLNDYIFKDLDGLMNNIKLVTDHLKKKGIETLTIVPTKTGELYLKGEDKYRLYEYVEGCVTFQIIDDSEVFKSVGSAFGAFQNQLSDCDASKLIETIPNFHNTPKRMKDFIYAVIENASGRKDTCQKEIDFVLDRVSTVSKVEDGLKDGSIPLRVTHNDTKLNNIMMDGKTLKPRVIVDLDTIMGGSMLYDFGDAIRFGASTAQEDEKDLDKVHFDIDLFRAFAEGFCPEVKDSITKRERELLPYSAYLITLECGSRFLADYIAGDVYFGTKYPEHNLDRARTQFKLAYEMENSFDEMTKIIDEILG